jgi:TctA family transporter
MIIMPSLIPIIAVLTPTAAYSSTASAAGGVFASIIIMFYLVFIFFFYCILPIIGIFALILWIIMLVDLTQRDISDFPTNFSDPKTMWLLIVLLTGWIGAGIYYFQIYKKYPRKK